MESKVLCLFLAVGFLIEFAAKKSKAARIASIAVIVTGCLIAIFWDFLASIV